TMASKGKEVVMYQSLKITRKGKKGASSSASKVSLARRFGAKAVEPHDKIRELGVGYIFNEPERYNLTLVRNFYTNWDTSFGESTK
ncbi:hypothetical protein HAX54_005459, partial [Datura stramonium]|nr:hypothetical protein [Datura stramonium]